MSKVESNWKEKLPKIAAVDFDGTLVEDNFPKIGRKNFIMFEEVKRLKSLGWKLILWTSRNGIQLDQAVKYCKKQGIEFDAINSNLPELIEMFGGDTRKVYADIYIDDKAVLPHRRNVRQAI